MTRQERRARLLREVRVETYRARGPGGQHVNKTESAVRVVHLPTGLRATADDTPSQARNRDLALDRLAARLERLRAKPKPRVATKPPRAAKLRRLTEKRVQGTRKAARRRPALDD
mgnify:CR=1 FL=1